MKDLATLLCCTPIMELDSYLSFVNQSRDGKGFIEFLGEFSNHQVLQINWEVNGKAEFFYRTDFDGFKQKIRFAFQAFIFVPTARK